MWVSNCLKYCIINKNALFSPSSSYYYLVFILFSLLSYVHFLRNHFWDEHDMKSYVRISTNFIAHLSVFLSNVTIVIFMLYANFTLTCKINFTLYICNNPLVIFTFIYYNDMNIGVVVLIQFTNQTCSGNSNVNI